MKRLIVLSITGLILLQPQVAAAQEAEGDADITNGSRAAPGVEVSASAPGYEVSNTPIETQAGTGIVVGAPSVGTAAPVIVGLSAHNCTPYTSSAGLDLGLNLGASGAGDCLTFSIPDPVQQVADRGRPRNRPGRGPDLEGLVRTAVDRAIALAGKPELKVAPDGVGLTGLPSYFWLAREPQPISASASAGGLTVTAEAFPVQYMWRFGDGADLITFTSGRPWTRDLPGDVEHTYETRDRYDLSVQVLYQARWQLNGGEWQALGFFSTSDARTYPVRQVVAVLVRPD